MSDTKYKLNEAKYFLGQMRSNTDNHVVFQYLLSACISALRSVTCFMQKEYAHTPNFSDWYKSKQAQMEADPMFSFFNKQRVITIHKKQIATQPQYIFHSPAIDTTKLVELGQMVSFKTIVSVDESGKQSQQITDIVDNVGALVGEGSTETQWLFDDLPQERNPDNIDVLTLCNQQLEKIEAIVLECEQIFIY
jgi:hypothetical protein